jgi:hypothetical protein
LKDVLEGNCRATISSFFFLVMRWVVLFSYVLTSRYATTSSKRQGHVTMHWCLKPWAKVNLSHYKQMISGICDSSRKLANTVWLQKQPAKQLCQDPRQSDFCKLKASCLQSRLSTTCTTWATPPVHFTLVILEMGSHELFA